ncbi:MAG: hypothetical protein DMF80_13415 [Acidobacteria bacterium]|nr:MAG: hypothetical protein DMF80_13415 [Acidobacteriota bacterium]
MRTTFPASQWRQVLLWLVALSCLGAGAADAQVLGFPTLHVSGGLFPGDPSKFQPLLFGWKSYIFFSGGNWYPNDVLMVHLYGPLNTLGVAPSDHALGLVYADNAGNISPGIDYYPRLRVPFSTTFALRPGNYTVYAEEANPSPKGIPLPRATAPERINISPETIPFEFPDANGILHFFQWSRARGGRDGLLGDQSPERTDPQWISVWSEAPVAVYGTIAATGGKEQPSFISHEDFPGNHYAHDADLMLLPDQEYRWILGSANFNGDLEAASTGRIEVEWETQNSGRPFADSYGTGNIGVPLWAMPTAGDRIFVVGRWALDNGHPDSGDRTEIHPPRLIATMRQRHTAVPFCASGGNTRASQVDVFVSGHGGGANQFPDGLGAATDNNGLGGGRLGDVLTDDLFGIYYEYGPASPSLLIDLAAWYSGFDSSRIREVAGPSGVGWPNGPEERPVNDMDYDFDVPLPAPPEGATSVQEKVITHAEHTTAVAEVITYIKPDAATGLPTMAHVHLPYNGADSGVYARTLEFYWDTYNPPGRHFVVRMNNLTFFPTSYWSGRAYVWADVSGQWTFLTALNPDRFLRAQDTLGGDLPASARWEVFLDPSDTLRVFAQGYDQQGFDDLFGIRDGVNQTTRPAYDVAQDIVGVAIDNKLKYPHNSPEDGDSEDIGGALFESLPNPKPIGVGTGIVGQHFALSQSNGAYRGAFSADFDVSYVPNPRIEVTGAPVDFGSVCTGSSQDGVVRIANDAPPFFSSDLYDDSDVLKGSVTVSGAGFSLIPASLVPQTTLAIAEYNGQHEDVIVRFSPTSITQGAGVLTINSNDLCRPALTVDLRGTLIYPVTTLSGSLEFGRVPVGARPPRGSKVLDFSINNTGECPVIVNSVAVTGGQVSDFHILTPPTFPATIPPGESLLVPVEFNPTRGGHRSATISVALGNDPTHPVPLTITANGGPELR